jgi:glucokinase
MILVGDIGGTKTNLALFPGDKVRSQPTAEASIPSADHDSLESVLDAFFGDQSPPVEAAAFGVAGPVVDGVSRITNLPWVIHESSLAKRLETRAVRLVNDLEATALGLALLRDDETETLQAGSSKGRGNRAVIAAGTGLGEATLVADRDRTIPIASEGGHVEFGPRDPLEVELWTWLHEKNARVEYEMLLSGPGLVNLYRFFHRHEGHADPWEGDEPTDPAASVSRAAMSGACTACRESLERFVTIYGAEAGNLALKTMATGGVFVAGGIAPKILPVLRDGRFLEAFNDKGAFTDLMRSIPVQVVLNPKTALLGAARVAWEALGRKLGDSS